MGFIAFLALSPVAAFFVAAALLMARWKEESMAGYGVTVAIFSLIGELVGFSISTHQASKECASNLCGLEPFLHGATSGLVAGGFIGLIIVAVLPRQK